MIGEVFGAISGINAAIDLAKSMKDASDAVAVCKIQADLLDQLVTAKAAQLDQLERHQQLEAELVRLRDWEGEKDRYEMVPLGRGGVAYALKQPERGTKPPHHLCADCFEKRNKHYLVSNILTTRTVWKCNGCSAEIIDRIEPPAGPIFVSGRDDPFSPAYS